VLGQYRSFGEIVARYYGAYGGASAMLGSPYLHLSLGLAALMWPLWRVPSWTDITLSVLPSLMGFSLGGFAMLLAVGDDGFRAILAGPARDSDKPSPLMGIAASFVHFLVMQTLSIVVALLIKAHLAVGVIVTPPGGAVLHGPALWISAAGFWLFVYALLLSMPAVFRVLRVVSWYDRYRAMRDPAPEATEKP